MSQSDENLIDINPQNKFTTPIWLNKIGVVLFFFILYFAIGGTISYFADLQMPKWLGLSHRVYSNLVNNNSKYTLLNYLIGFSYTIAIIYFFWKLVIKKPFAEIGFTDTHWLKNLLLGILGGMLAISLGFIIELYFGFVHIEQIEFSMPDLTNYFIMFTLVAIAEETMTRGLMLHTLMEGMNKYIALIIVSVIFGALHLLNDNVTWLSFINISLAGIFLGISYIYNKSLWFPIGLHLTWNFFQGPIYGFEVSGNKNQSLIVQTVHGNVLITGGEFGFEGSLLAIPIMLFASFLFYRFFKNKDKILPV